MRCPYCSADRDRVLDTRPAHGGTAIRRRRACAACGERFSTIERSEAVPLTVVKRDGLLEPFDARKVAAGIGEAVKNLELDDDTVRSTTAQVEERLRAHARGHIESAEIGAEVLTVLRALHEVAYMRFASVYKGFTSPDDFRRELANLEKHDPPQAR